MKQLSISPTNPLLAVARYGGLRDHRRTDLCNLFWRTLWGVIRAPFWVSLIGTIGATLIFILVALPLLDLYFWIAHGLALSEAFWLPTAVWALVALLVGQFWYFDSDTAEPMRDKVSGACSSTADLIRAAYRGWKEKTCVVVDIKSNT